MLRKKIQQITGTICPPRRLRAVAAFAIAIVALESCTGRGQTTTQYAKNREADQNLPFDETYFRASIGEEKYAALRSSMSDSDFNLLLYGTGQSNAIVLVNSITEVGRITAILNGPDAVPVSDLVALINAVDAHLRAGRYFPGLPNADSTDTLAKISKLVNNVSNVLALQKIINGAENNPVDTAYNRIERLALLVALTNQNVNTVSDLISNIVAPPPSPYIIDGINYAKLLRLLNEINDLARLAQLINGISPVAGIQNVTDLVRELTNTAVGGVTHTIELLNDTGVNIAHIVQLVNGLTLNGQALPNSDSFVGTPDWGVPSATHNWAGFSSLGTSTGWYYTSGGAPANAPAMNFNMASSGAGRHSVLHTNFKVVNAGSLSFTLGITALSAGSQVQVAVTGCINQIQSYASVGTFGVSFALSTGTCHLKIVTEGPGGYIYVTGVTAPGLQGANRSPAQKVAILLNKITNGGNEKLGHILTANVSGTEQALNATGIDNLIKLVDRAHYPAVIGADPTLVTFINNLSAIDVLRRVLNNLDTNGVRQLTEVVNFLTNINKGAEFVNSLQAADATKVYTVINALNANATWSLIDALDNLALAQVPQLASFVHGVSSVNHIATILGTLSPIHYTVRQGVSVHFSPTDSGGKKLADLLNLIITGGSMTIANEMVRLSDDLAAGGGAQALSHLVNALDQTASPRGTQRLYDLVNSLKGQAFPRYNHSYDLSDGGTDHAGGGDAASAADHFGRLTTLANNLSGTGVDVMAAMVNYVDHAQFAKLTQLVRDARRIHYVADLANRLANTELLIAAIPPADMTAMIHILNGVGDSTQRGSVAKAVGDMFIFVDAMNRLQFYPGGTTREIAKQINIVQLINQVNKCGIHPDADENNIWPKYHLAEVTPQCQNAADQSRKRATNVMLGLENAEGLALLVGDINQLDKVVKLMNGGRSAADLARIVNLIPPQVMLAHLNALSLDHWYYGNAVERSLVYLINRLSPDDIARVVHYGTGIGKGTRWINCVHWIAGVPYNSGGERGYHEEYNPCHSADTTYYHYKTDRRSTNSGCSYYRGVGPTRMAAFLNLEGGAHMSFLMSKYGARVITAAVGCGTATRSAAVTGINTALIGTIDSSESTGIQRGAGNYSHSYHASPANVCQTNYTGGIAHGTNNWNVNTRGYLPEVFASTNFYPLWAVDPHWWGIDLWTPSRVLDNMLYDHLGELYFLMPSPLLPSTAGAGTPPDCDVVPYRDANTGWTNAVGDGTTAPN